MRKYSHFDQFVMNADTALRTLFGGAVESGRQYPAENVATDANFSAQEKKTYLQLNAH